MTNWAAVQGKPMVLAPKNGQGRKVTERWTRVRSVSSDDIDMTYGEMLRLVRHPIALIFLFFWICMLLLVDLRGEARNFPVLVDTLFYLACMTIGTGFILVVIGIRLRFSSREIMLVRATPMSISTSLLLTGFSEFTVYLVGGPMLTRFTDLLLLFFFLLVMTEVYMAILANYVSPAILADLRRGAPVTPPAVADVAQQREPPQAPAPATAILQIQALRNQTRIISTDGEQLVNIRFSAMVDTMPQGVGVLLHRSHWVSIPAIKGFRRDGRDIIVVLTTGAEVPVAQSRHREILPWLATHSRRLPAPAPG